MIAATPRSWWPSCSVGCGRRFFATRFFLRDGFLRPMAAVVGRARWLNLIFLLRLNSSFYFPILLFIGAFIFDSFKI
jgi:hypothetical protein